MTWEEKQTEILRKQNEMDIMTENYKSMVIFQDKDKKLYWRHIFSYLPYDIMMEIQDKVYTHLHKITYIPKVIRLSYHLFKWDNYTQKYFGDEPFIKSELSFQLLLRYGLSKFRMGKKNQHLHEYRDSHIIQFHIDNFEKYKRDIIQRNNTSSLFKGNMIDIKSKGYNYVCSGIKKDGKVCGCKGKMYIEGMNPFEEYDDEIKYKKTCMNLMETQERKHNGMNEGRILRRTIINRHLQFWFCKIHHKQIQKLNKKDFVEYKRKIYENHGYVDKHGYLCKMC